MAGQNWTFDPVKRDYVLEQGTFVPTDRVFEKSYFILALPRTRWLYGTATQGSFLWRLKNAKRLASTEQTFSTEVNNALRLQLVAPGQALRANTSNVASSRQGTSNNINITTQEKPKTSGLSFAPIA